MNIGGELSIYKIRKHLFYDMFFLLFLILIYFIDDINNLLFGKALVMIAILSSAQLIYKYKGHDTIAIFLIFGVMYWLYLLPFYFLDIPYHYITEYQKIEYTNNIVIFQMIFIRIFFLGISTTSTAIPRYRLECRNDDVIYTVLILILILMIPVAMLLTPPPSSTTYSVDTKSSIWFEYVIIFIIVAYLYAGSKIKKSILFFIITVYMFIPLMYGKRGTFLMISLLLFNLYVSGKFKFKYIFVVIILVFLFFRIYAAVRVNADISLLSVFLGVNIDEFGNPYLSNNQGGVIVCSVTYFGLIEEGVYDLVFRLKSFLGTVFSVFLPSKLNLEETFINTVTLKHANIPGNGGLPGIYLYMWGGLTGVILGSFVFRYLINNKANSRLIFIYLIFMFSTYPRWYAYNMFILIKMGFWLFFLLSIADTYYKSFHTTAIKGGG